MIVQAHCKFCRIPLSLDVSDDYIEMGDHLKLLPLASCNRCSDHMEGRRYIIFRIKRQATLLMQKVVVTKEAKEATAENLRYLLKLYMRHLAAYRKANVPDWDENVLAGLLASPGDYIEVLRYIPSMFVQRTLL